MRRRFDSPLLGALLLLVLSVLAPVTQARADDDHRGKFYGRTRAEWFNLYVRNYLAGGPDKIGKVKLLPFPVGEYVSGSGTPEDPAVTTGHLNITLKRNTPFVMTIMFFYGELYQPGTPVPFNPDPLLPPGSWELSKFVLKIDGKVVADSTCNKDRWFVPAQIYNPPIFYSQPSSYGSIAAVFGEGYLLLQRPLKKGKHTMSLDGTLILPGNNFYPNIPTGLGSRFLNTWTITVK
ncbi:MAG: hypothetical protein SFU56_08185 [Capsulimonadales bacterium]|nr:hypothetical protein [Capsulimonadales bacterium]